MFLPRYGAHLSGASSTVWPIRWMHWPSTPTLRAPSSLPGASCCHATRAASTLRLLCTRSNGHLYPARAPSQDGTARSSSRGKPRWRRDCRSNHMCSRNQRLTTERGSQTLWTPSNSWRMPVPANGRPPLRPRFKTPSGIGASGSRLSMQARGLASCTFRTHGSPVPARPKPCILCARPLRGKCYPLFRNCFVTCIPASTNR